jgi:hypothetical protein
MRLGAGLTDPATGVCTTTEPQVVPTLILEAISVAIPVVATGGTEDHLAVRVGNGIGGAVRIGHASDCQEYCSD